MRPIVPWPRPKLTPPPDWIKPGALADYHNIIGGEVTETGHVVRTEPHLLGGHTWVVWLEEKAGCVACSALSQGKSSPPFKVVR